MHEHARFQCMLQDKNKIKIKKINQLEELFIITDSIKRTTDKTSTVYLMMHRAPGAYYVRKNGISELIHKTLLLTLGAHAQRGLQYLVCVYVCVYDYSRTTGYEAAYERYQQLQCYKGKKNNVVILLKRLRSRDMA